MADMTANGVHVIDGQMRSRSSASSPRGRQRTAAYFSRDSHWLYVSNRGEGTVAVIDLRTRTLADEVDDSWRWQPGHGRGVSAGRRQGVVAVGPLSRRGVCVRYQRDGHLVARIPVSSVDRTACAVLTARPL